MKRQLVMILAACLALGTVSADDLLGTRYVAENGADAGDCDEPRAPCRTLGYALMRARAGDTVKMAAGTYDVSGLNTEAAFFGPVAVRGGFDAATHFHALADEQQPTRLFGADPDYRNGLAARGFLPLDGSGQPLPASQSQKALPPASCSNGSANGFPCRNIDFLAQIPLNGFSSQPQSASNVWGFVDRDDNREYAVIGLHNGTGVVDVTDPANPREVGTVAGNPSIWRELKIYQYRDVAASRYKAYAYVSTEAAGGGLQIIDLTGLPQSVSLANTLRDFDSAHTVYVSNIDYSANEVLPGARAFLYVAGSNLTGGAFRIYDLQDPASPRLVTAPPTGTQYMHDSTSVLITDSRTTQCAAAHNPCEVLVDFNEDSVDLWDVTDKTAPAKLSSTTYPTASYVHSGWWTTDKRHIIVHDELDELRRSLNTQIYTLDIGDLRAPSIVTSFVGPDTSTDHNGYVVDARYYVAHYRRGLVLFDVANPRALIEVGYFDTYLNPSANTAGTDGAWGVYPFLPSGTVLVSDIENGLFLLKRNETVGPTPPALPPPAPPGAPLAPSRGGGGAIDAPTIAVLALLLVFGVRSRRRPA